MLIALVLPVPGGSAAQVLFAPDTSQRRSREFDVVHYALTLSFDEAAGRVRGTTAIRLTPFLGRLDSVVLDAVDLSVSGVKRGDESPLVFRNESPRLSIILDRTYAFGETLTVLIDYECVPRRGLYFIRGDSTRGRPRSQIWTQGEDMDNRFWFPCYDYPNDKATSEVIATVQENYTLLSNGRLVDVKHDRNAGTKTFHWVESLPHASYLIMVAAGEYAVRRERYGNIPLTYYVYREDSAKTDLVFSATRGMMKFFESWTGVPYPWEKFAQIILDDFMWGGMENTSAVTLNASTMVDARARLEFPSEPVVAHELAHQWWGDLVTCRDWNHLWLHEGFATYFEALYEEATKGRDEFQYQMIQASFQVRSADRDQGRRPMVSHDPRPVDLYQRGAWVLHMLRSILGDEAFQRGMRLYLRRYAYANAETDEFRLAIEDATGQNLEWFFDQWVYGEGFPQLSVDKTWEAGTRTLVLTVTQLQSPDSLRSLFRFPLQVHIVTPTEDRRTTLDVRRRAESFRIPLRENPLMVIADKGYVLLKQLTFQKSMEEYLYQLAHAEDVADRIAAAQGLAVHGDSSRACAGLVAAALGDRFWGVRQAAVGVLGGIGHGLPAEALRAVLADPNSLVRNTAVAAMAGWALPGMGRVLDSLARHDPSYLVASTCIRELASVDSAQGFSLARDMLGVPSYRNLVQEAALSGMRTLRERAGLPFVIPLTERRVPEDIRISALHTIGVLGKGDREARRCLEGLLADPLPRVRVAAVVAAETWKDAGLRSLFNQRLDVEQHPDVRAALVRAIAEDAPDPEHQE
jgi:aminopeptidase N